jgi:hypothetical protein
MYLPFSNQVSDVNAGKGLGALNAPAAKEQPKAGEAPAASDSGNSNVSVDSSAN